MEKSKFALQGFSYSTDKYHVCINPIWCKEGGVENTLFSYFYSFPKKYGYFYLFYVNGMVQVYFLLDNIYYCQEGTEMDKLASIYKGGTVRSSRKGKLLTKIGAKLQRFKQLLFLQDMRL